MATGVIILAAGASTRMGGQPKQELRYRGQTLLQHALRTAVDAACSPVVVVLRPGANMQLLPEPGIIVAENPGWAEGMSASIRCGLRALLAEAPAVNGAVLMVCDQPFTEASLLNKLVERQANSGKGIVACHYNHTLGTPVLFSAAYFEELLYLRGKEGAKKLLFRHAADVEAVDFEPGAVDIDTPADYDLLKRSESEG